MSRSKLSFRQIEAFRAVMLAGTTIGAANRLCVSQPAVSRLIAQLEDATRLRLFVREKKRLSPTNEAAALFREVERSFNGLEAIGRAADAIRNVTYGSLRLTCFPALAHQFIPTVIGRFREQYPHIAVTLQTSRSSMVVDWVASMDFDLGLASGSLEVAGVQAERFIELPGVCILPPGHRLASQPVIRPQDCAGEAFISLSAEDEVRQRVDLAFSRAGVDRRLVAESSLAHGICSMVLAHVGIAIVNPVVAADGAKDGLVARPFEPDILFTSTLVRPVHRPPSLVAQAFERILKDARDALVSDLAPRRARAGAAAARGFG